MKFLVTGGSGFLGEGLARRLKEDGHDVVLLSRSVQSTSNIGELFKADITDIKSLERCKEMFPNIDGIIHLAALVPKSQEEDEAGKMIAVNVTGTMNLLEVFGDSIRNFVYASTAEVYGLPKHKAVINETQAPEPLSYYGASKLAGESFCKVYAARHELAVSMLRFTVLYGPGDTINRAIPNFIKKVQNRENIAVFGGEELRDYLHVTDATEALFLAATKSPRGVFNIGTGEGISIKDTAQAILDASDSKLSINIKPRQKKAADIVLDISRARKELGFEPRHTFPDLIEEQIEWHKNN